MTAKPVPMADVVLSDVSKKLERLQKDCQSALMDFLRDPLCVYAEEELKDVLKTYGEFVSKIQELTNE